MSRFEAIAYALPHFDALTQVVIRVSSAQLFVFVKRTYFKSLLKVYYLFRMGRHCLWKMCATPDACINETALFILATVVPQSKSTELSSSAAPFHISS